MSWKNVLLLLITGSLMKSDAEISSIEPKCVAYAPEDYVKTLAPQSPTLIWFHYELINLDGVNVQDNVSSNYELNPTLITSFSVLHTSNEHHLDLERYKTSNIQTIRVRFHAHHSSRPLQILLLVPAIQRT